MGARQSCDVRHFYPRSPCGERHRTRPTANTGATKFLSTLSLRRATGIIDIVNNIVNNFYPRSPCGERLVDSVKLTNFVLFLSTLSLRRATRRHCGNNGGPIYFYPRSPCGERQPATSRNDKHDIFLSTLSLRRATAKVHKTVGHFCAYGTNFMGIASSC